MILHKISVFLTGLLRFSRKSLYPESITAAMFTLPKNKKSTSVVLKVIDIDPQGSTGPSRGSISSHGGTEWGSLNGQGVSE